MNILERDMRSGITWQFKLEHLGGALLQVSLVITFDRPG